MQITFIGGGNMAAAIIGGLVREGGHQIRVIERTEARCAQLRSEYGVEASTTQPEAFGPDEVVVLAVKPQQLKEVCVELAPRLQGALTVSIAAGVRVAALSRWLGSERIVRVMPNTPAMVGKGISGVYAPPGVSVADAASAADVMRAVGEVVALAEEGGIDDITCVSGSGPAYVFYFMEAMIAAAKQAGFDPMTARKLVVGTFEGAVALAAATDTEVGTLRANVTSKGGTTERAIARFDAEGVREAIVAGAMDCRDRSMEMGETLSRD